MQYKLSSDSSVSSLSQVSGRCSINSENSGATVSIESSASIVNCVNSVLSLNSVISLGGGVPSISDSICIVGQAFGLACRVAGHDLISWDCAFIET